MTKRWVTLRATVVLAAQLAACDRGASSDVPAVASQTTTVTTSATTTTSSAEISTTHTVSTRKTGAQVAVSASPAGPVAPVAVVPGSALIVWTAAEPPLESEMIGLGQMEKWLTSAGQKVTLREAAPEEKAFIELVAVAPDTEVALPATLGASELVVVVALEPPRGKPPNRLSGGRSRLLIWHPPAAAPVLSVLYDAGGAGPLGAQDLAKWLKRHLTLAKEEK